MDYPRAIEKLFKDAYIISLGFIDETGKTYSLVRTKEELIKILWSSLD